MITAAGNDTLKSELVCPECDSKEYYGVVKIEEKEAGITRHVFIESAAEFQESWDGLKNHTIVPMGSEFKVGDYYMLKELGDFSRYTGRIIEGKILNINEYSIKDQDFMVLDCKHIRRIESGFKPRSA